MVTSIKDPRNDSLVIEWDIIKPRDDMVTLVKDPRSGSLVIETSIIRSKTYDIWPIRS